MATNGSPRDPQLVEKIVAEVKSQGVFDEFRRGSIADVDTKPAYQNLRQRVDNTVKQFLSEQDWTPETNKNQLREKLRRYISDSGFLDVGVERIVDQVVNPKIGAVFRPKIEEIAYKYLNIAPPKPRTEPYQQLLHTLPPLPINGVHLNVDTSLLPTDLEQVSPDSDKATMKSDLKDDSVEMDVEKTDDDDESPPFEPIENSYRNFKKDAIKHIDESDAEATSTPIYNGDESLSTSGGIKESVECNKKSSSKTSFNDKIIKEQNITSEVNISQESQLSHVSSKSNPHDISQSPKEATVNISEEAQMPNFCDNSSDENVLKNEGLELHFDIKKDEIKFEGTERRSWSTTSSLSKNPSTEKTFDADEQATLKLNEENQTILSINNKSNTNSQNECSESIENNKNYTKNNKETTNKRPSIEELSLMQSSSKNASINLQRTDPNAKEFIKEVSPQPPATISTCNKDNISSPKLHGSSSSSSRHKRKHSKDRHRSHDKDKEHRKERDSRSERHGSSSSSYKHLASSSSHYHKSYRSSNAHKSSKPERDSRSSSSLKNNTSSCSSSSRIEGQKYEHSSRRTSEKHTRKSFSSSKHSSRRDKYDDHYEYKNKLPRRKSSDSNEDGEKSLDAENKNNSLTDSVKNKSNEQKESNAQTSDTPKTNENISDKCNTEDVVMQNSAINKYQKASVNANNVVILNELLANNPASFIQLESGCSVITPLNVEKGSCNSGNLIDVPDNLLGFSDDASFSKELTNTITILDSIKENVRNSITYKSYSEPNKENVEDDLEHEDVIMKNTETEEDKLNYFASIEQNAEESENDKSVPVNVTNNNITKDTTTISSVNNHELNQERTPEKGLKPEEHTKPSPTLSDASVNSKENEHLYKDNGTIKRSFNTKNDNINKLCKQQRYESEDLYKPRPVLSQRSRRRGIDIVN